MKSVLDLIWNYVLYIQITLLETLKIIFFSYPIRRLRTPLVGCRSVELYGRRTFTNNTYAPKQGTVYFPENVKFTHCVYHRNICNMRYALLLIVKTEVNQIERHCWTLYMIAIIYTQYLLYTKWGIWKRRFHHFLFICDL